MTVSNTRFKKLIISALALLSIIMFFNSIILLKAPDISSDFFLTIIPPVLGFAALLFLASQNEDPASSLVILLFAFLVIGGNSYQCVIQINQAIKIMLLNAVALCCATGALIVYVFVIKKKVLTGKRGYIKAIIFVAAAILFLFLIHSSSVHLYSSTLTTLQTQPGRISL